MKQSKLNLLAEKVINARMEFDLKLHGERPFPFGAFESLWVALNEYATALGDSDSISRPVAREINGFREYLELASFNTPAEVLAKADRMETILFAGYDSYFEGEEPGGL